MGGRSTVVTAMVAVVVVMVRARPHEGRAWRRSAGHWPFLGVKRGDKEEIGSPLGGLDMATILGNGFDPYTIRGMDGKEGVWDAPTPGVWFGSDPLSTRHGRWHRTAV